MDTVRDCGSHFIALLKLWVQHKVGKLNLELRFWLGIHAST
jgi:hypothetical protein